MNGTIKFKNGNFYKGELHNGMLYGIENSPPFNFILTKINFKIINSISNLG
jgi:hypothetical protein